MEKSKNLPFGAFLALRLIRLYQQLTIGMAPRCRFAPSCSQYAFDAIDHYGFFGGTWRTVKRVLKCHPWHPGGWDPVTLKETSCNKRMS